MPTRRLAVLFLALLAAPAFAQQAPPSPPQRPRQPDFTPPDKGAQDEGAASRRAETPPAVAPIDAPAPQPPADPVDVLFLRLSKWPAKPARDAAIALSGLGADVEARLIANLSHNDWRVQAGCARALADMGSKRAVKPLAVAIKDPTNGAALAELLSSIVRIDPVEGPREVLPFLSHQAGRVRMAAMQAIPNPLDQRYAADAAEMFKSRNPGVRATAITLLTRIPEAITREELFLALLDPEVAVSNPAARHLAAFGDETVLRRLKDLAREGTLRQAAYALVALTLAEDSRGIVLVFDGDPVRDRAYAMLHGDDPFYRASAAIFLSNVAFRSDDTALRELADRYLVSILLDAVAGGTFYNDYVAIEELAYRKLELLSGESYGQSSLKWRGWWQGAADGFKARHQLRAVSSEDLLGCVMSVRVEDGSGRIRAATFVGDAVRAGPAVAARSYVLGSRDRDVVKAALESSRFFVLRSPPEAGRGGGVLTEVTVQCGEDRLTVRYGSDPPPAFAQLAETLFDVARSLSWQRFAPKNPAARAQYIREQTEFFSSADGEARRVRLLDLALSGYQDFTREGRAAAVEILALSSPEFCARNAARLLEMLRAEPALNEESAALVALLSTVDTVPVREQVLAFLGRAPAARANDVVKDFLSRQPRNNVIAALRSEAPVTRVAAAEALARFKGDRDVASILIEAIGDFDPRVREAAVRTLATFDDDRIPAMLESAISGQDKALRVRAIEALGPVQKGEAVPRLMEVFRGGDVHERHAVLRALGQIQEKRATVALASIVRECPDVQIAGEALNVLAKSTDPGAPAEVAEIFRKARVPDLRLQAVDALATLRGQDAVPDLLPSLEAEDADLRRVVLLTLARLGAREALAPLARALDKPEGDPAAEAAFSRLTYFVSDHKAPAHRALDYQRFVDESGRLQRSEWFARALRELKLDPALTEGFEIDAPVDARQFDVLVRVVAEGNWAMRAEAEARLLAECALKLAPLARAATPEDVQQRSGVYRRWLEGNADALGSARRKSASRPAPAPESRPQGRPESR
jgi:HEAT repeat protein